jgi:integrase
MAKKERPILTAAQARTLIEGTRGDRLHALWTLAVTTGLRNAELLGLAWSEVDLAAPALRVSATLQRIPTGDLWPSGKRKHAARLADPKTDKSKRTIPLTAVAVEALREHRRRQLEDQARTGHLGKSGLVFATARGRPLHGSNLPKALRPHLERLGLPRITVHDLRQSAATVLFASGVPMPVISDILGHRTTRITEDLYRHRVPELSREAAKRMQEAVG